MSLLQFLSDHFRGGIRYEDAAELCKAIYAKGALLPTSVDHTSLSMDVIAEAFAALAKLGLIEGYSTYKAVVFGASYHAIEDKGHWIEVQASILKLGATYDADRVKTLLDKGQSRNT